MRGDGNSGGLKIALFWKQNDSGIYNRRHDMLCQALASHDEVELLVQVDAPIGLAKLRDLAGNEAGNPLNQARHIAASAINRFLRAGDSRKLKRRTFIHGPAGSDLLGVTLPERADFPAWVKEQLDEYGGADKFICWLCPVIPDVRGLLELNDFRLVVADLIDDQRQGDLTEQGRDTAERAYAENLDASAVIFANDKALAQAFPAYAHRITVVEHGFRQTVGARAVDNAVVTTGKSQQPIIGYVGNLRDRIDVDLLEQIALTRPGWHLRLIGSAHGDPPVLRLQSLANVEFVGPIRADEVDDYIREFDVAIVPHEDNAISQAMSPLKVRTYRELGKPVVATAVNGISATPEGVFVEKDRSSFIERIDRILLQGLDYPPSEFAALKNWGAVAEEMLSFIRDALRR